jgi:hypothetical protein
MKNVDVHEVMYWLCRPVLAILVIYAITRLI